MSDVSADTEASINLETGRAVEGARGLFARQATGLVREVSGWQQVVLNYISGMPPIGLSIGIFFALGGFPGGNLIVAALLALPIAVAIAYTYGLLTAAMPRTGGDYVFVSRILHPVGGLISSCAFGLAGFTTIAFGCIAFATLALSPALSTVGVISDSSTLVDWGATLAENENWQFGIGIPIIIVGCLSVLGGWRAARRVLFSLTLLAMAGLGVTLLVAIVTSQSHFENSFNSFAASRGVENAYQSVIDGAREAGTPIGSGFSWSQTFPMVAVLAFSGIYAWFSSFIGGEIRQGSSLKTAHRNGISAILVMGGLTLCIAIFFRSFGQDFLTAAFGGGLPPELGTTPAYFYLTSAQFDSTIIAVILCSAFLGVFVLQIPYQVLFITRYLFAWSFDGLLPKAWTHLNSRGAPDVAVVFTVVASLLVYAWAIYVADFVQVLTYNLLFTFVSMGLVAISAIVFPYRFPALYRASSSNVRLLGMPLMVWTGATSLVCLGLLTYMYFHFEYFGLADKAGLIPWVVGILVVAVLLYVVPRIVRRREGIDLSLVYAEIPPD